MHRIIIICCYFGKFPPFFPAWIFSCKHNSSIHFLLVTDQAVSDLPENVECSQSSLLQIRERARQILGFEPCLKSAYKLCDYKVLYGLIFKEHCKGYDFWGHCDMDMVFGDLRRFLKEDVLRKNDRIYPYGHLALYRNTEDCSRRFMKNGSPYSYREVFTSDEVFFFDERCYVEICRANSFPFYDRIEMADIRSRHKRFCVHESLRNYNWQIFLWSKGHLFRYYAEEKNEKGDNFKEEEFPYIHFKRRPQMQENIRKSGLDEYENFFERMQGKFGFAICEQGFIPLDEKPDINAIEKYNRFRGKTIEIIESLLYEENAKLKHVKVRIQRLRAIIIKGLGIRGGLNSNI